jgi:hypothetical protein
MGIFIHMEYVKLDGLENQYPSAESYGNINETTSVLNGLYPAKNKIAFKKPKLSDITPVSKTNFRFLLSITNGKDSPAKLFTSEPYYNDLTDSFSKDNPYFLNKSLDEPFIVKIDISKLLEVASTLAKNEVRDEAEVTQNVFLKQQAKITSNQNVLIQQKTKNTELVKKRDNLRKDVSEKQKALDKIFSYNTKKRKPAREALQAAQLLLAATEKELEASNAEVTSGTTKTLTLDDVKLNPDLVELVRYFDWVLTADNFSPSSADTGGVKPANEIGSWKINLYNPASFAEIDTSQYVDPTLATNDEESGGTAVGNFIRKIEKIPVIGTIVTGVKAVVNVVGNAVKAVGNFFKKLFSDKRVKNNIVKVATIGDVNVYKFNYIWDTDKDEYGVIAQELLGTKYESAVFVDEDSGLYKVDYEKLNEMVDIQSFINQLENKV